MSSYAYFVQTCREEHKKKHPDASVNFAEFSKKCSERWKVEENRWIDEDLANQSCLIPNFGHENRLQVGLGDTAEKNYGNDEV